MSLWNRPRCHVLPSSWQWSLLILFLHRRLSTGWSQIWRINWNSKWSRQWMQVEYYWMMNLCSRINNIIFHMLAMRTYPLHPSWRLFCRVRMCLVEFGLPFEWWYVPSPCIKLCIHFDSFSFSHSYRFSSSIPLGWTWPLPPIRQQQQQQHLCSEWNPDNHISRQVRSFAASIDSHLTISSLYQRNPIECSSYTLQAWLRRY